MRKSVKKNVTKGRMKMPGEKAFVDFAKQALEEMAQIKANLQTIDESQSEKMDHIGKRLQTIEHILTGNGSPEKGVILRLDRIEQANPIELVVRLDRLEQDDKRRTWWVRAAVVASLAAVAEGLATIFRGH